MKGFTLIEVIIYITLFSIIITGAFTVAYALLDSSDKLNTKAVILEEGNFVLRKFNFVLTSLDFLAPPVISGVGCSQTLTANKIGFISNPIVIRLNTISGLNYIEMRQGDGSFLPITTANASTTCLKFQNIPAVSGVTAGITGIATMNGIDFTITKYLKK